MFRRMGNFLSSLASPPRTTAPPLDPPMPRPTPEAIEAARAISSAWLGLSIAYIDLHLATDEKVDVAEGVSMALDRAAFWERAATLAEAHLRP